MYLALSRKCGFSWFTKFKAPQIISLLGEEHLVLLVKYTSPEDKNQWKIKTDKQHLSIMNFSSEVTREQTKLYAWFFCCFYCTIFSKAVNFQHNCVWYSSYCSNPKVKKRKESQLGNVLKIGFLWLCGVFEVFLKWQNGNITVFLWLYIGIGFNSQISNSTQFSVPGVFYWPGTSCSLEPINRKY